MRLADIILRSGHLSERALVEAVMTGERPVHLERCDICAERAVELGRWLDGVRATGIEAADMAFPPERLLAQQQQIMRRLEQLDQPTRVIAFPNQYKLTRENTGRRVAAGWLGVAAAAGVILGVLTSQATERLANRTKNPVTPAATAQQPADQGTDAPPVTTTSLASTANSEQLPNMLEEIDRPNLPAIEAMESMTPRVIQPKSASVRAPQKIK